MKMQYKYGDSYEQYPILPNQIWHETISNSFISICDIIDKFPSYMYKADMIYCDPPWNLSNINSFYTKANLNHIIDFSIFYGALFKRIKEISAEVCYIEIGKQNKELFITQLESIYKIVQCWEITYYKRNKCYLLRGASHNISFSYDRYDDENTPFIAIQNEPYQCIADLCTGRGLTFISTYKLKKQFVGTELNARRLAVTIDRIIQIGGQFNIEDV